MKAYIIAIVVALLLIAGCKAPVEEVVEEPVEEVEEVVEEPKVDTSLEVPQQVEELSYEGVDEKAQRLIDACKAGNVGLCVALETKYGIVMSPEGDAAEEPEEAPAEE